MEDITRIMQLLRQLDDEKKRYQKTIRAGGWPITAPQLGALRVISQNPGLSITSLAEIMGIHVTTAEGYANRLLQKEMITAVKDPEDKRRNQLRVTVLGEKIIAGVPLGYKSQLVHNLRRADDGTTKQIRQGLEKLIELMSEGDY